MKALLAVITHKPPVKKQLMRERRNGSYTWRTCSQQEIDLVEEREGRLVGYEAKWSVRKSAQAPRLWTETYANSEYQVITPQNYLDLVV